MRTCLFALLATLGAYLPLSAQSPTAAPQTARQALIEMFLSNDPDLFSKHLPEAARKLLRNGFEPYASTILQVSTFGRPMFLQRGNREIFDAGPIILRNESGQGDGMEIVVEHDTLAGETNEIELSAHFYRDGQEQTLSVIPRLTFTLKQEKSVWRLIEVSATARIPLTDPDYLHALRRRQQEGNESSAQMRIDTIGTAETAYAAKHPDRGYSCDLSALFAQEPDDNPAGDNSDGPQIFYDPGQGSSEWNGYRFALKGCEGSPASKYQITAVPVDSEAATKTYCADESGTLKFIAGATVADCLSRGETISVANEPPVE